MAYTQFSVGEVDYVLDGVNHIFARRDRDLFNSLDFLVTEYYTYGDFFVDPNNISSDERKLCGGSRFGSNDLVPKLREGDIRLFSLEPGINLTNKQYNVFHRKGNPVFPLAYVWTLIHYSLSKREIPEEVISLIFAVNRQILISTVRSAIVAEKIECLTKLSTRKNRRLRVGIVYGLCHVDIVEYLKSKDLRRRTIRDYENSGYPGLDIRTLDLCKEYKFDSQQQYGGMFPPAWRVTKTNMNLFVDGNFSPPD